MCGVLQVSSGGVPIVRLIAHAQQDPISGTTHTDISGPKYCNLRSLNPQPYITFEILNNGYL